MKNSNSLPIDLYTSTYNIEKAINEVFNYQTREELSFEVQGAFDAINAENSIPLLGSTLSVYSRLFKAILTHSKRVYGALDKDAEKKALSIVYALISHGVEVYKIDTSDYEDVGEMTKEEFESRRDVATLFDSSALLLQKISQI